MSETEPIPTTELVIEVAMLLGILSLGIATGVYLAFQIVLSQVRVLPDGDVMIRLSGDLFAALSALQDITVGAAVLGAALLIAGAGVARHEQIRTQLRDWWEGTPDA